jgi:hypothetical protein
MPNVHYILRSMLQYFQRLRMQHFVSVRFLPAAVCHLPPAVY